MGGHNIKENGSGKYDPTAYNAIRNVSMDEQAEEEKFKKLLGTIFNLCELSGFHLEERIVVKKTNEQEEFGGNKYGMVIYNRFYDCRVALLEIQTHLHVLDYLP